MRKLFLLPLLACAVSLTPTLAAETYLIENGQPKARIIIPKNPPRTVKAAAEELQSSLKEITGAELPISDSDEETAGVRIFVGASAATEKLGVKNADLKNGAFRMVSGKNWLALVGGDKDFVPKEPYGHSGAEAEYKRVDDEWDKITGDKYDLLFKYIWRKRDPKTGLWEYDLDNSGSYNAVARFLHDLGMRWYQPGPLGQVTPSLKSVALPKVDLTVKPDFPLRNLYIHGGNFYRGDKVAIAWQMRLGLNQGQDILAFGPNLAVSHGIKWPISRQEIKDSMPELYQLRSGKRLTEKGVPCLSSEELLQRNVKYIRAMFDQYDVPMVSVMPTDGFMSLCECSLCQGKSTPQRGFYGVLSDYVWEYVTKVANEVAKTHPDKKIHCLAYTSYMLPPEKIAKLPPNVVVGVAQSPSGFYLEKTKNFFKDVRAGWSKKITSGVPFYQYEYYLHGWKARWPGIPAIYPDLIADDLRALKGISMGNYIEVFPTPANYINAYVTARFSWDASLDLKAEMNEYYRLFFGPAEKQMKSYIEYCEANWMKMPNSVEHITRAFELVAEARKAAGEGIYGERVAQFEKFMEPMNEKKKQLQEKIANARKLQALFKKDEVKLDGKLDEPFWQDLPSYEMRPIAPNEDKTIQTTVRMGWKDGGIYVGIRCDEPQMDKVSLKVTENGDMNLWVTDCVEIMLETQSHSHYQIAVSPMGAMVDVDRSAGIDTMWTSGAKVVTTREKDHWIVEVMIPVAESAQGEVDLLNGVAGVIPTAKDPWYVNVGRTRWVSGKSESYSLTGYPFHEKIHFAELIVPEKK